MKNKLKTINFKILFPITISILLEAFFIIIALMFGTKPKLEDSLIDGFKSNVEVRTNYLETSMSNKWSYLDNEYQNVLQNCEDYVVSTGLSINEILNNETYSTELLKRQVDVLPRILSSNNVTNCFLILNNTNNDSIFLSTKNPNKVTATETNVNFAPTSIVQYYYRNGYNIDQNAYTFRFSDFISHEFYTKPIIFANNNNVSFKISGYWSADMKLGNTNVFTYTVPITFNNVVIGAIGVGLSTTYLQTYFNSFSKGTSFNVELIRKSNDTLQEVFKAFSDYSIPSLNSVNLIKTDFSDIYSFEYDNVVEFTYSDEVNLNSNAYDDTWYFIGIMPKKDLLRVSDNASTNVFYIILLGTIFTLTLLYIFTLLLSKPIIRVSNDINENNITNIPKTNIYEVDLLLKNIEFYFNRSLELNKKLDRVINDSNTNIAVAEYIIDGDYITTTSKFYSMLKLNCSNESVSKDLFIERIKSISADIISSNPRLDSVSDNIFKESCEFVILIDGSYLRLKTVVSKAGAIITLIDLTREYEEKKRIEHERDYDILTGLLNRRGFFSYAENDFHNINDCALFMIDIDNLKKFNDEYGHEFGDKYIKAVGAFFYELQNKYDNLIAGHLSGDEFILYLSNPRMNEVNEISKEIEAVKNRYIECYDSKKYISLSCGVALYEKNITINELKKRADFTMYSVKKSGKNSIAFFDTLAYELYKKEDLLVEELNKLIKNNLVRYAYQPIVSLKTGDVLGYEALMRSMVSDFNSPLMVIDYAKKYNKLYEIEQLTFFNAAENFIKSKSNKLLFINSIASQILNENDFSKFTSKYNSILDNIIIEIIEEDFGQGDVINKKIDRILHFNMNYAIDDYGTGFNNLGMLLNYSPSYIKIEGSLIRDIDHDNKKRQFTKSIIDFCKANNMLIIAESVETEEELKCVKDLGCDYVQGYLISKPDFEIKDISTKMKKFIQDI